MTGSGAEPQKITHKLLRRASFFFQNSAAELTTYHGMNLPGNHTADFD